ncbi:hypothetical protein CDCA_CDCA07G2138 [Cyanidium caldarium]|uniref:P-type domain-containing protein n=1 Tax=Cyanidium caldarium TaxID=2771 RepID=A0AAV9IUY8_CYACA|nr:hypothetical protein CDCA_CDCA07G2138 [Cyanidium caldarium]
MSIRKFLFLALAVLTALAAAGPSWVRAAPAMAAAVSRQSSSSGGLNATYIGTQCSIYLCGDAGSNQQTCYDYQCCWQTDSQYGFGSTGQGVCVSYTPTSICNISAGDRQSIGYPDITPAECLNSGGCWNPLPPTEVGPWCYAPVGYSPPPQQQLPTVDCDVGNYKVQCYSGWKNMNQQDCMAQGCCWESNPNMGYSDSIIVSQSSVQNTQKQVSWYGNEFGYCYQSLMTCNVTIATRQNCGYPGITEQQCLQQQCCFDPFYLPPVLQQKYNLQTVPWCYYKIPVINYPPGWNATAALGLYGMNKSWYKKYYPKQQPQTYSPFDSQQSSQGVIVSSSSQQSQSQPTQGVIVSSSGSSDSGSSYVSSSGSSSYTSSSSGSGSSVYSSSALTGSEPRPAASPGAEVYPAPAPSTLA